MGKVKIIYEHQLVEDEEMRQNGKKCEFGMCGSVKLGV